MSDPVADEAVVGSLLAIADLGYRRRMAEGLPPNVETARAATRGDCLADFIVLEIHEVATGSEEPVHEAIEALRRAQEDLGNVIAALEETCDGNGWLKP